ncbi:MAG TPA: His/Gly/Thr/Pro-type tRNA ligase C-terminal domain-containing protein, partial [Angustibacter sp.]|nr:His/Gly/Thr/Pro-type tRNA ligase C-terminal domain-containing protein [Angustibacter sp.]
LWQEGHTAHATQADAAAYARRILHEVYEDFMVTVLAVPVVVGRKTVRERFAGATATMSLEAMMGDAKALQMGTSHELGQNFARAFGIDFLDAAGERQLAWTTSWGTSTRMLGGLIMCHGDDDGLRVPPLLAAVQVLVTVVKDGEGVTAAARRLVDDLAAAGVRVELDDRTDTPFGRRAVDAELKGVPVRVEVGPRDLAEGQVTVVRRVPQTKTPTALADVAGTVMAALAADPRALHDEALDRRERLTADVTTVDEAAEAASAGWARIPWATLGVEGEAALAARGVTVRCLVRPDGGVPDSDDEPGAVAVVARAY